MVVGADIALNSREQKFSRSGALWSAIGKAPAAWAAPGTPKGERCVHWGEGGGTNNRMTADNVVASLNDFSRRSPEEFAQPGRGRRMARKRLKGLLQRQCDISRAAPGLRTLPIAGHGPRRQRCPAQASRDTRSPVRGDCPRNDVKFATGISLTLGLSRAI